MIEPRKCQTCGALLTDDLDLLSGECARCTLNDLAPSEPRGRMAHRRPLLLIRFGRTFDLRRWDLQRELRIVLILAPFPEEEQVEGAYVSALVNAGISLRLRWPFVSIDVHSADRWTSKPRGHHD